MSQVSIILPAYNEEELLPEAIASIRRAEEALGIQVELIVVDNNSSDRTAEVARDLGATVVFEPVNQISRARNAGGRIATGDYLVFLDADSQFEPETLRQALVALQSGKTCVGGALLRGDQEWKGFSVFLVWLWLWISRIQQFAAGSFVFCTREAYEAVGGFDESVYAGEEIFFAKRIKRWGKSRGQKFKLIEDPPITTSSRKGEMFGSWQLFLQFTLLLVFPWCVRSRRLCWVWYKRPAEANVAESVS